MSIQLLTIEDIKPLENKIEQLIKLLKQPKPDASGKDIYTRAELWTMLGIKTWHAWYRQKPKLIASGMVKIGQNYRLTPDQFNQFLTPIKS